MYIQTIYLHVFMHMWICVCSYIHTYTYVYIQHEYCIFGHIGYVCVDTCIQICRYVFMCTYIKIFI